MRLISNLNLASSSASNFIISDRSVAFVDPLASLRYRLIFSRVTNLSTAASKGLSDIQTACAFWAAEASSMSGSGHFTRLRSTGRTGWLGAAALPEKCDSAASASALSTRYLSAVQTSIAVAPRHFGAKNVRTIAKFAPDFVWRSVLCRFDDGHKKAAGTANDRSGKSMSGIRRN